MGLCDLAPGAVLYRATEKPCMGSFAWPKNEDGFRAAEGRPPEMDNKMGKIAPMETPRRQKR